MQTRKLSYPVLVVFFSLTAWGLFLIPQLPLSLYPSHVAPTIEVSFYWPETSPSVIENKVTSLCEGFLARLEDISRVRSSTYQGSAVVQVEFEESVDAELKLNEVRALIRILAAEIPEEVSYPSISLSDRQADKDALMILSVYNEGGGEEVSLLAQNQIAPHLAQIKGMGEVIVSRQHETEWTLSYDADKLSNYGIPAVSLAQQLRPYFHSFGLTPRIAIRPSLTQDQLSHQLMHFQINSDSTAYLLKSFADISYAPAPPHSYYRLNGQKATNIILYAEPETNQLALAKEVYQELSQLQASIGPELEIDISMDSTNFIREELSKMWQRCAIVLVLLLLFVVAISRSLSYLVIVFLSLLSTLGIASLVYYVLDIEVNLYSMAAITISFGIIIDNVLVMMQHLRWRGDQKVIRTLITATLTTIIPILLLIFEKGSIRLAYQDFVAAICINFVLSIAIAKWLIPVLMDQLMLQPQVSTTVSFSHKRRTVRWLRIYTELIQILQRKKWILTVAFFLTFGIPIFLLPSKIDLESNKENLLIEEDRSKTFERFVRRYNATVGNEYVDKHIRPFVDKWFGGTLRLFIENTFLEGKFHEPRRLKLNIRATAPQGTTLQQLNELMLQLESFLSQYGKNIIFETHVLNGQQAEMQIYFDRSVEKTDFPARLQNALTVFAIETGGVDWNIWGVVLGFNNATQSGKKTSLITLYGYNYPQLLKEAEQLKERLLSNQRVEEVFLNGRMRFDYRPDVQYHLILDPQKLAARGITQKELFEQIRERTIDKHLLYQGELGGETVQIVLRNQASTQWDIWRLQNAHIQLKNGTLVKLSEIGEIKESHSEQVIDKENQQYKILLEFNYLGPQKKERKFTSQMAELVNKELPIGFFAVPNNEDLENGDPFSEAPLMVLIAFCLIYAVIAIALNSLTQAMWVVWTIPLSFIGVFVLYFWGEFLFDQGGYAGFLLLSGITVNSALYIVQAYLEAKNRQPYRRDLSLFMKGFAERIAPVIFTILSTVLGFIPFLLQGEEAFWYSLALVCMGGLIFSLVGIVIYLPVFLCRTHL